MHKALTAIALTLVLTACGEFHDGGANNDHMDHSEHMKIENAEANDAQRAYAAVNARMHEGMADIPEDADVAFMQGMLAHHIGAVEMAEVALEYGEDEQVRDLAQRIIDAQAVEIEEMESWLAAREAAE